MVVKKRREILEVVEPAGPHLLHQLISNDFAIDIRISAGKFPPRLLPPKIPPKTRHYKVSSDITLSIGAA
jgi:hypothetical protein